MSDFITFTKLSKIHCYQLEGTVSLEFYVNTRTWTQIFLFHSLRGNDFSRCPLKKGAENTATGCSRCIRSTSPVSYPSLLRNTQLVGGFLPVVLYAVLRMTGKGIPAIAFRLEGS